MNEEKNLDRPFSFGYNKKAVAGLAHLVERHLAKVEVASSSLVTRSKKDANRRPFSFGAGGRIISIKGQQLF